MKVSNHPNWLIFSRNSMSDNDFLRVITYVNIRLAPFQFSLHKDLLNHRDISLVLFFNNNDIFYMMNIYSDSSQSALKYLKDTEANFQNILIITENFNIRDNLWDPLYPHHSSHSDDLFIIADWFNLGLFISTNQVPTRYSDNCQEVNLVLDLIFLHFGSDEFNNYIIHLDWRLTSDHTPLTIVIPIVEEHIQTKK